MVYQLIDYNQNLSSSDNYSGDWVGLRNYKCVGVLTCLSPRNIPG